MVAQRAGAGERDIAVGVGFHVAGEPRQQRLAVLADPFGDGDNTAAQAFILRLNRSQELVHLKRVFRQVNQVRPVIPGLAAKRRRSGQKAGMTAHHGDDVDAGQGPVVQVDAGKGTGHEAGGRGIARRVVVDREIVVDGLRHVDTAQRIVGLSRLGGNDAQSVGGVVAADIEERVDFVRLQHLEDLVAVLAVGLVAGAAEGGRRGAGDKLQIVRGLLGQIQKVLVDDAAHPAERTVDVLDGLVFPRFDDDAGKGFVDHGRRGRLPGRPVPYPAAWTCLSILVGPVDAAGRRHYCQAGPFRKA